MRCVIPIFYGDIDELKNFNELSKQEQEFVKSALKEPQKHLVSFVNIIFHAQT